MISIERSLKQAAWADDQLFTAVAKMPTEALKATYATDEWTVARLLQHIVGGVEWYRYILTGAKWTDLVLPESAADIESLRVHLAQLHKEVLAEASKDDERLSFEDEDGQSSAMRSTVITMVAHHSCEHRAQIGAALEIHGFPGLSLDDIDLWAYESANG